MSLPPLHRFVDRLWYSGSALSSALAPLSLVVEKVVKHRRRRYEASVETRAPGQPVVVVVGNVTVGGTGKTPLVMTLARHWSDLGWRVGIVLRGYGGSATREARRLTGHESAAEVGDEALLLQRSTGLPVAVGRQRQQAVDLLSKDCDVILSDDGLQHYAMRRDLEIAVVDGERCFGNGRLLPAGPLREPLHRLNSVDFVVINGGACDVEGSAMQVVPTRAQALGGGEQRELAHFKGQTVRAVAGIGNPQRFFNALREAGLSVEEAPFPDHHHYIADDFRFDSPLPVLMTAKDAAKCRDLDLDDVWVVEVDVRFEDDFLAQVTATMQSRSHRP